MFQEDLASNALGWRGEYGPTGIHFVNAADTTGKQWGGVWSVQNQLLEIHGDTIIEATFSKQARMFGFYVSLDDQSNYNKVAVVVTHGQKDNPESTDPYLEYIRGSKREVLAPLNGILGAETDPVTLKVMIKDNLMTVSINGQVVATKTENDLRFYKYFSGIVSGYGDDFYVTSLKVWVMTPEDIRLVKP